MFSAAVLDKKHIFVFSVKVKVLDLSFEIKDLEGLNLVLWVKINVF